MKPLTKIACITFILLLSYSCAVQKQQQPQYTQDQGQVGLQVFYDELSPYGNWVDYSNYGYIWIPDVRREFAPYSTNGHWVMTDYGWTWVSDYRWGWAPFHYGRWDYDDYYGWFWVPGNEWGPAWVTWRGGNGYYGWAPMRPGMNINSSYTDEYRDINRWHFVRDRDFGRNDLDRYYVNRGNYTTIINNSTVINNTTVDRRRNTTYVAGPPEDNVQRASGRNINRVRIQDNQRPGEKLGNNELKIYRPQVERTADRRTVPAKVTDIRNIKPVRERGTGNSRNDITPSENTGEQRQTDQTPQKERRRIIKQPVDQPPTEKSTQIPQTRTESPEINPSQQDQNNRRRTERQRIPEAQRQNRQMEQNRPGVSQQSTPQPPVSEQNEIQQEQQIRQDRTKEIQIQKQQQQQIQQQQQQVERKQQQLEKQQQMQRRRMERQQTRQQQQIEKSQPIPSTQPAEQPNEQEQKEAAPSGSRRR